MTRSELTPEKVLPHRPPFLFLDEILAVTPGSSATARLTVDPDLPLLQGHFPDRPIFPGVLIVEAMAQAAGVALGEEEGSIGLLAGIRSARFFQPVSPGESLLLSAEIQDRIGPLADVKASASLRGEVVATAHLQLFVTGR